MVPGINLVGYISDFLILTSSSTHLISLSKEGKKATRK